MKTIYRRLRELEKTFIPAVAAGSGWGRLAKIRDDLIQRAEPEGPAAVAQLRAELEQLGPTGLWRETVRHHLQKHGFVQQGDESFAETMARALAISIQELRAHLMQGTIGKVLLERFASPE